MSMTETHDIEARLAARITPESSKAITASAQSGGLVFTDASQIMEFSRIMAVAGVAVPKHLRGNVGACMAVCIQAFEWRMSPFAVANKSYSVNDRMAYESQLVQAVILQRAPIKGRIRYAFVGQGDNRVCKASATLSDGTGDVEYESPALSRIPTKNSPLWKGDPDQQLAYYSGRALCRRYFPDVLLGVYTDDEIEHSPQIGADRARDVTPPKTMTERLDAIAAKPKAAPAPTPEHEPAHDPETGEIPLADEGTFDNASLLDIAREAAMGGKHEFDLWAHGLTKAERDELQPHMGGLAKAAKEAGI